MPEDEDTQPEELVAQAWPPILRPRVIRMGDGSCEVWGDAGTSPVLLMRPKSAVDAVAIMTQMIDGKSRISTAFRAGVAIGKASAELRAKREPEHG